MTKEDSMKIKHRKYKLLAALLVLALLLPGCGKPTEDEVPELLTGIFAAQRVDVPDNFEMLPYVTPHMEDGEITVLSLTRQEADLEDGTWAWSTSAWLNTLSSDGKLLDSVPLPKDDNVQYIYGGVITNDAVYYADSTTENTAVYRYDRATGQTTSTPHDFWGYRNFGMDWIAADSDGLLYCANKTVLIALNADLSLAFTYAFPIPIHSLARGADGKIWVEYRDNGNYAAPIDPEKRGPGKEYAFSRVQSAAGRTLLDAPESGSYDFCCFDAEGVWGVTISDKGKLNEEKLVDFTNSGLTEFHAGTDFLGSAAGLYPMAMFGDDFLLAGDFNGRNRCVPVLCRRSEDIDPNTVQTLTVAHTCALEPAMVDHIRTFNREHPGVQLVIEDYSRFASNADPRGGETQLCFDLLNAGFQPDIILTDASAVTLSEQSVAFQITKNDLYVDLAPYLKNDAELRYDDLFACIPRLFDDGKGGMWGVSAGMEITGKKAVPERLNGMADRGCWTLEEMLDCFDARPEDTDILYGASRVLHVSNWIAQGYGYFIDGQTCSFDSELFRRYLRFVKSLPADWAEWQRSQQRFRAPIPRKRSEPGGFCSVFPVPSMSSGAHTTGYPTAKRASSPSVRRRIRTPATSWERPARSSLPDTPTIPISASRS